MNHPGARPQTEAQRKRSALSPEWDVGDGRAPRLKYAIFSLPRTGSTNLCAHLRRRGIGVPLEYLGAGSIAARLGCLDAAGNTPLAPYFEQLFAKRTTPNGIFGTTIHPGHLRSFAREDVDAAADFLRTFDRVLALRRRDKVLQAISLVRAQVTQQFHVFPGETERSVPEEAGNSLFVRIAAELATIVRDERYMERILARLDPGKVRGAWYEDVSDSVIDQIATWMSAGAPPLDPSQQPYAGTLLPRRGNIQEALDLKRRFLAHVTGQTN